MHVPAVVRPAWNHSSIRFARVVLRDLAKSAMILLSLEVIWWILKRMELMGYPPDQLAYFERVHFCSSLTAFVLLALNFLVKLGIALYREES